VVLSPSLSPEMIETRVDAATINGVQWGGGKLALTAALSHVLELEVELDLLGSGYNADLSSNEMETLWTQTCQASGSLSSHVTPSGAYCPPDGAGEE
jgi:hypothetical protein